MAKPLRGGQERSIPPAVLRGLQGQLAPFRLGSHFLLLWTGTAGRAPSPGGDPLPLGGPAGNLRTWHSGARLLARRRRGLGAGCILDSSLEGTVDVASGRGCSVASLTQNLAAQLGRPHLLRLGERPAAPEPDRIVGDNRRLLHELCWHPQVPLDEGLARTVAWWREQLAAAPGPSA